MRVDIVQNGAVVLSKEVGEGSYKIGRSSECDFQLKSSQISKQHALLVIKGNRAAIVDLGSANGVFVNGILVRKQRVEAKDDVRIVDFQIKIGGSDRAKPPPRRGSQGAQVGFDGNAALNMEYGGMPSTSAAEPEQLSPQEKFLKVMDEKVMTPYFGIVKTCDWRWVLSTVLLGALISSVLLSVIPVVRWGQGITTKEALSRAHTIANQTVRENFRVLSKTNDFTRLTVEAAEAEKGVLAALIVDQKTGSILAPAKLFNRSLNDIYSKIAIQRVTESKDDKVEVAAEDDVWIVAQPINVYSPETNENEMKAIVLVTFQVTNEVSSTFQPMVEASLFAALFSLVAFFLIYKMFTHPLNKMQEQLDAALKGDNVVVTSEAKMPELEALATTINFSLARLKQAGGDAMPVTGDDSEEQDAGFTQAVMEFDQGTSDALLLLDREKKIRYVGKAMEELLSMRSQYAQGQNISDACRDPGFSGTAIDLTERVIGSLGDMQTAMLDINGIARNMSAVGHKNTGGEIRFILLTVKLNNA